MAAARGLALCPGDPWLFGGDMASALVPKTCIPVAPGVLSPEEFSTLGYLRAQLSEGTAGTVEEYAGFNGVGSSSGPRSCSTRSATW